MAKVKGLCKNIDECSMAENREVQEVEKSAQFVCAECGKPLVAQKGKETDGDGDGMPKWIIPVVAAVVVIGGGVAGFCMLDNKESSSVERTSGGNDVSTEDDEKPPLPVHIESTFTGKIIDGQAHGTGRFIFNKDRRIDMHDDKGRVALAGEYIIGEWDNGHLIQGRWYDVNDNLKETIILGKSNNPTKDHELGTCQSVQDHGAEK